MERLHHYTCAPGLDGISRSKSLHATEYLSVNDQSEYMYGWRVLYNRALTMLSSRPPFDEPEYRDVLVGNDEIVKDFIGRMKLNAASTNGYDNLYVVSFARPRSVHEHREGVLTLWREYTKLEGYCLHFDRDDLEALVRAEGARHAFGAIRLADVIYGIDDDDEDAARLSSEFADHLELQLAQGLRDGRIKPKPNAGLVSAEFAADFLVFCATRKHPSFSDEREVRILAVPADPTALGLFSPPLRSIRIQRRASGARFIDLGAGRVPGLSPKHVILGPRATLDEEEIRQRFRNGDPTVSRSTIPV